jgi:predicted dinucleotide-binding enzyme
MRIGIIGAGNIGGTLAKRLTALGHEGLFADARADLVVVDTGNYYPQQRDGRIDDLEDGLTESRWVEQQLGHPVVMPSTTSMRTT